VEPVPRPAAETLARVSHFQRRPVPAHPIGEQPYAARRNHVVSTRSVAGGILAVVVGRHYPSHPYADFDAYSNACGERCPRNGLAASLRLSALLCWAWVRVKPRSRGRQLCRDGSNQSRAADSIIQMASFFHQITNPVITIATRARLETDTRICPGVPHRSPV
jgi:hypothetical protein